MAACDVTEIITETTANSNSTTEINDNSKEFGIFNSSAVSLVNSSNLTLDQEYNATNFNCDADGMRATPLRQNEWYLIFYVVVSKVILVEFIPWLTVIALNIWTWRKMVLFQRKREAMLKKCKKGKCI